jgi:hypothetical protein
MVRAHALNLCLGLLAAMCCVVAPGFARACSTPGPVQPSPHAVWPLDGAVVSRSPVLVVQAGGRAVRLYNEDDGSEVPLELVHSILQTEDTGNVLFHRPAAQLAADADYALRTSIIGEQPEVLARFTTSEQVEEPPTSVPSLRYHRMLPNLSCTSSNGGCAARVELEVTRSPTQEPSWLVIRGAGARVVKVTGAPARQESFYLAFEQDVEESCIDYEWVDARGGVHPEARCEPDECAVADGTVTTARDSCSSHPEALGARLWDLIDAESCAAPPSFGQDKEGRLFVKSQQVTACALTIRREGMPPWWCTASALALAGTRLRRARRERDPHSRGAGP